MAPDSTTVALARQNAGAVIGALGVLAGSVFTFSFAAITAVLEHRRRVKATRAQWQREDELRDRAARAAAYEELIRLAQAVNASVLRHTLPSKRVPGASVPVDELTLSIETLYAALARVRLVGSSVAAQKASVLTGATIMVVEAAVARFAGKLPESALDRASEAMGEAFGAFVNSARADLDQEAISFGDAAQSMVNPPKSLE